MQILKYLTSSCEFVPCAGFRHVAWRSSFTAALRGAPEVLVLEKEIVAGDRISLVSNDWSNEINIDVIHVDAHSVTLQTDCSAHCDDPRQKGPAYSLQEGGLLTLQLSEGIEIMELADNRAIVQLTLTRFDLNHATTSA